MYVDLQMTPRGQDNRVLCNIADAGPSVQAREHACICTSHSAARRGEGSRAETRSKKPKSSQHREEDLAPSFITSLLAQRRSRKEC